MKISILKDSKFEKKFLIFSNNKKFFFEYKYKEIKEHYINSVNYISKKNYIEPMLKCVLNKKFDPKENHEKALFCCLLIEMILKEYNKKIKVM